MNFDNIQNSIALTLLGLFLLTGTIFFLRWNLQNDIKRNDYWSKQEKLCGFKAYQNNDGQCVSVK